MFFVIFYLYLYWVIGVIFGNLFGGMLFVNLVGVEFVMIVLFLVIFVENWLKEKLYESLLFGLGIVFVLLIVVGKEYFLILILIGIWVILILCCL